MQPTTDKFAKVPKDEDTRVKSQRQICINGVDALHQRWVWDGVAGESLIFREGDVCATADAQMVEMARHAGLIANAANCTVTRSESGFVFLNFGFE